MKFTQQGLYNPATTNESTFLNTSIFVITNLKSCTYLLYLKQEHFKILECQLQIKH